MGERLVHWVRNYHCKVCGAYFSRRRKYCPVCKTRKGGRGTAPPAGWLPF